MDKSRNSKRCASSSKSSRVETRNEHSSHPTCLSTHDGRGDEPDDDLFRELSAQVWSESFARCSALGCSHRNLAHEDVGACNDPPPRGARPASMESPPFTALRLCLDQLYRTTPPSVNRDLSLAEPTTSLSRAIVLMHRGSCSELNIPITKCRFVKFDRTFLSLSLTLDEK